MTSTLRVADALVGRLADRGVDTVFMVAGGGIMFVNDAIQRESRMRVIPMHHEQSVAIATDYANRCRQGSAIAVVTMGPGGLNALTGVASAWYDSVPMIIISGQVKRADRLSGSLRQLGVQEANVQAAASEFVKDFLVVEDPTDTIGVVDNAVRLAHDGRPGPVWIEIPLDVQGAPFPDVEFALPPNDVASRSVDAPTTEDMRRVLALLVAADRPAIIGGLGVWHSQAQTSFRDLIERLGIPVFLTWAAMDLLESDHPLVIGRPGIVAERGVNIALQNADLIISIGSRLDRSLTAFNIAGFGRQAKRIMVDIDAAEIEKHDGNIEFGVRADAGAFIDALLSSLEGIEDFRHEGWLERCRALRHRYPMETAPVGAPMSTRTPHLRAVEVISKHTPEGAVVVPGSSGLAIEMFFAGFQIKQGQRVMHSGGLGAMGFGLPGAVGAAVASSETVVCVEGDGSLMLNIQELATIRAMNLPIKLLLMNNVGYASIRSTQRNYFDGRYIGTGSESGLFFPDWEVIANAFHIPYFRADTPENIDRVVEAALDTEGPMICDIYTLEDESLLPKVTAMPQPDGSIVSMPMEDMAPLLPIAELEEVMEIPLAEVSYRVRKSTGGLA
jgi:acetolactate synthase-1/2/3 large subunit